MGTHNILFPGEIRKISIFLKKHLIKNFVLKKFSLNQYLCHTPIMKGKNKCWF